MIWWCRSDPINFLTPYIQIADLTLTLCLFFSGFTPRRLLPLDIWTLAAFDAGV